MQETTNLDQKLEGCPSVNLKQLAKKHFTIEYLQQQKEILMNGCRQKLDSENQEPYFPSRAQKCLIHYCSGELIKDLWSFSQPKLKDFLDENNRSDLEKFLQLDSSYELSDNLGENIRLGDNIIYKLKYNIFDNWIESLGMRVEKGNESDSIPLMWEVYHYYSQLAYQMDFGCSSNMERSFTSAGGMRFHWLKDYPNLSREELEEIIRNSDDEIEYARKLGIESEALETVSSEITDRTQPFYVYNPRSKKIILNPTYLLKIEMTKKIIEGSYHDRTDLLLQCPAIFVPSTLYGKTNNMFTDDNRFKDSIYVELYLITQNKQ